MDPAKLVRVWITKHALGTGVTEHNAERVNDRMVRIVGHNGYGDTYYHKNDWHTSKEAADARVRQMIEAKIKSLNKTLAKMLKLKEEYK